MTDPTPTPGAYIPAGKTPPPLDAPTGPRVAAAHAASLAIFALAVIGGLLGAWLLWMHLSSDPVADARAYYDAARRLNLGQPLYPAHADPNVAEFYRYPPLLAIILRPFALLPYSLFAVLWEVAIVVAFVATIRRLGGGRNTWLAVGLLGIPIGWAIGVGQAQILVTYLVAVGQPWSIAFAGQLKLFPVLVAIWWLGRRDWQALGAFVGWSLIFGLVQLFLAPDATKAFFGILAPEQIGDVRNFSPYVISPILWMILATAGAVAAVVWAPTRWGWPIAVALATLSPPRLLTYMLTSLLAGIREPRQPGDAEDGTGVPGASDAYVASAR